MESNEKSSRRRGTGALLPTASFSQRTQVRRPRFRYKAVPQICLVSAFIIVVWLLYSKAFKMINDSDGTEIRAHVHVETPVILEDYIDSQNLLPLPTSESAPLSDKLIPLSDEEINDSLVKENGTFINEAYLGKSRAGTGTALRIALITNAIMQSDDKDAAIKLARFNEYIANKQCYAETHGYDLIVDSRNHVEGMGFYVDSDIGKWGPTNIHFNKPYLLKKWISHYDWVLWLDLDSLIMDMGRPLEWFIDQLADDTHVLVPQDQNNVLFFSAYALLLRGSPESQEMLNDWFSLKDVCPFAMYDDQSRLYSALLRMQLRVLNVEIDRNSIAHTDCLDFCEQKDTQKMFSWCFDKSVKRNGYRRMPHLKGPVAFSRLPTNEFKNGDDTGLVMQGMFGGIQIRPELIHKAFAVHVKPICLKGAITCAPFLDALLSEVYNNGMEKCFGNQGWILDPVSILTSLSKVPGGDEANQEMVGNQFVPGLNIEFAIPFNHKHTISNDGTFPMKYQFRNFGEKKDYQVCMGSVPAAGGDIFSKYVLQPILSALSCERSNICGRTMISDKIINGEKHTPCNLHSVGHHFPYTLTREYRAKYSQPGWLMTFIRDPIDRVIISWLRLTSSLDRTSEKCLDGAVSLDKNEPIGLFEYSKRAGTDEIYTKFFAGQSWNSGNWNHQCVGGAPKQKYKDKNEWAFHYYQGNQAAATLLEYQYIGIFEFWNQSIALLNATLNVGHPEYVLTQEMPIVTVEDALQLELPEDSLQVEFHRLRKDQSIRDAITSSNKKDIMFYNRVVQEFKRRCRYLGISLI